MIRNTIPRLCLLVSNCKIRCTIVIDSNAFSSFSSFADNELYSGTVADFSGSDPIIYREPLQTEQYDSLSLNGMIVVLVFYFSLTKFVCWSKYFQCDRLFQNFNYVAEWLFQSEWFVCFVKSLRIFHQNPIYTYVLYTCSISIHSFRSFIFFAAPNFISSFTQDDFVYFFFRETAVEYINCGKVSNRYAIETIFECV